MKTEWIAYYKDGTKLPQYVYKAEDDDVENAEVVEENAYKDIERNKLAKFTLFRDSKPAITIHLDKNKQLICRRRIAMDMFSNIKEEVWLVGWHENRNGVNLQSIMFLFEDGRVEVLDKFRNDHPFDKINFMKEEKLEGEK